MGSLLVKLVRRTLFSCLANRHENRQQADERSLFQRDQLTTIMYNHNMAIYVPLITERERIPAEAIEDVVQQIIKKFNPLKIILFGSYALILMDTKLRPIQQEIEICRNITYDFGLDLLVYTPENFAERISWGDSFLKEIRREGKVLYESTGA